jgi:hypothetical protein
MVHTCSSSQEDRQVNGISLNKVSLLEAEAEGNESEQVICQVTSLSQPLSAISLSSHNPPTQVYYALRPDGSCGPVHAASSTNAT